MTKNQENKLSMYITVQQVTNYFSEAWKNFMPFKNQFSEFETLIGKIKAIRPVQEEKITGITKDKWEMRKAASLKAKEIADHLYAYASMTGNNKLKDRVAYRASEFDTCRDTVVIDYIQIIYNAASQYLPEMAEFELTPESLDELKALQDAFSEVVENPRQAVTNKSKATIYISEYFKQADTVIKERLDKMINYFKEKSPDFWHQFKSARKIVNLGQRKKVEKEADGTEMLAG